jgi:hypothetical protein
MSMYLLEGDPKRCSTRLALDQVSRPLVRSMVHTVHEPGGDPKVEIDMYNTVLGYGKGAVRCIRPSGLMLPAEEYYGSEKTCR